VKCSSMQVCSLAALASGLEIFSVRVLCSKETITQMCLLVSMLVLAIA
jgi:hypothetical protein